MAYYFRDSKCFAIFILETLSCPIPLETPMISPYLIYRLERSWPIPLATPIVSPYLIKDYNSPGLFL